MQQIVDYFVNAYDAKTILVEVDLAKYDCMPYEMLGFKLASIKFEPTWCRLRFKKSTTNVIKQADINIDDVKQLLHIADIDGSVNVESLLLSHGYVRVYDCGHAMLAYHIY